MTIFVPGKGLPDSSTPGGVVLIPLRKLGGTGFFVPFCLFLFFLTELKTQISRLKTIFVPGKGLEPLRYCYHRILNPARLPIPPPGLFNKSVEQLKPKLNR
jgi:hypothetical protein